MAGYRYYFEEVTRYTTPQFHRILKPCVSGVVTMFIPA